MRHRWLLVVAILGVQAAQGAPNPVPAPGPANPKALQAESRRFAQRMNAVVDQVVEKYVRPVGREDLLEAAVAGLFDAARKPVPRDLRSQVRQAVALTSALRAQSGDVRPAPVALASSSSARVDPVERMLARLRTEVGEADLGDDSLAIACRAVAKKLDPYSGVVTAEEQRRMANRDQETVGVGLEFRPQVAPGPYEVEAVHPGSPAQRAGLRPGDVITRLDGVPTGKASPQSVLALRSRELPDDIVPLARPVQPGDQPAKTPERVSVTYRRGQGAERTAELIRDRYRPETVQGVRRRDDNSWDYVLDARARIAHVRVGNLSRGTSDELREVLSSLREQKIRNIILDLRWSPGGYLHEAVEVAEFFLGEALVATLETRGKKDVQRGGSPGKFRDLTVVVLVNSDTSGGAELIAAALQDHGRAVVVGQRTLGKASVQTPVPLGLEGIQLKLTSGTFVRPSGKNLHRFPEDGPSAVWGVVPDEDARLSLDLGRRLKGWWQALSLRPASSNERVALDDPRADPQQQAALAVMRKRMKETPAK